MTTPLKVLSLFTGVGGFDLGFERAGMEVIGQAESDPKARSVLERHWPGVTLHADVHDITASDYPDVDVLCGGFPCQDISIAGKQKGIARGDKSVLWWEFYRIIHDLRPRWVVIENVANLLNINGGRDLGAIIGSLDELGYMGEWRILDSQGFGVPQRRRRVFLVGHFGGRGGPAVLLEPEGGAGSDPTGREAEEEATPESAGSVGASGQIEIAGSLMAGASGRGYRIGAEEAASGFIIPARTGTITANWGKGAGNTQVDEGILVPAIMTPYAWAENQRAEVRTMDAFNALASNGGEPGQGYPAVHEPMGVRRLTPRECERLQGFPDDWTLHAANGGRIADTHRYRFMGNAVTVNVVEWIGRRLVAVDQDFSNNLSTYP